MHRMPTSLNELSNPEQRKLDSLFARLREGAVGGLARLPSTALRTLRRGRAPVRAVRALPARAARAAAGLPGVRTACDGRRRVRGMPAQATALRGHRRRPRLRVPARPADPGAQVRTSARTGAAARRRPGRCGTARAGAVCGCRGGRAAAAVARATTRARLQPVDRDRQDRRAPHRPAARAAPVAHGARTAAGVAALARAGGQRPRRVRLRRSASPAGTSRCSTTS